MDIGNGGNNTTHNTDAIVSIHLIDYSDDCHKHNDDRLIESYESTANDGRISINDNISNGDAPNAVSKLKNKNIDDDVIICDNDDGNTNDNNDTEDMLSDDNNDDSTQEDSVTANTNTTSTANPPDATPPLIQLVAMADCGNDDNDNDIGSYDNFFSE